MNRAEAAGDGIDGSMNPPIPPKGVGAFLRDPLVLTLVPVAPFLLVWVNVRTTAGGNHEAEMALLQQASPFGVIAGVWVPLAALVGTLIVVLQRYFPARPGRPDPAAIAFLVGLLTIPVALLCFFAGTAYAAWLRRAEKAGINPLPSGGDDQLLEAIRDLRESGISWWTQGLFSFGMVVTFIVGVTVAVVERNFLLGGLQFCGIWVMLFHQVSSMIREEDDWFYSVIFRRILRAIVLIFTAILIIALAASTSVARWLPVERIEMTGSTSASYREGIVLSVDDLSMLVLQDEGRLEYLKTDDVVSRAVCPQESEDSSWAFTVRSVAELLQESSSGEIWEDPLCQIELDGTVE
jgi:hypothetical protein